MNDACLHRKCRAAKRYEPIFTIKIHEVGKIKFGAGKAARLAFCYEIGKDHSLFGQYHVLVLVLLLRHFLCKMGMKFQFC